MATINFKINARGKSSTTKIYVRFRETNIDIEIPTHLVIDKAHWNPTKQEVKKIAESDTYRNDVNEQLADLNKKIIAAFNKVEDGFVDKDWLKDIIGEHQNKPKASTPEEHVYLAAFGSYYAKNSEDRINTRTGKPISQRTIYDFGNTVNKLLKYEKKQKKRVKLAEADLAFHRSFVKFLREDEKLAANTIGGQIDNIKAFLREASIEGHQVNNAHLSKQFNAPSSKTLDPYLNEEEIQRIFEHKFELDGYKDNARDWLIISVWTGLRVSDLLDLTSEDTKDMYIDVTAKKTGIDVAIPFHPMVAAILDKRNGQFPRQITDQKYNNYIKEVCKEVGLTQYIKGAKLDVIGHKPNGEAIYRKVEDRYQKWELITSHIGRRSFATNLYGKIDTLTLMKITGHSTEKQFLSYIKMTPKEHAQRLAERWKQLYALPVAA